MNHSHFAIARLLLNGLGSFNYHGVFFLAFDDFAAASSVYYATITTSFDLPGKL